MLLLASESTCALQVGGGRGWKEKDGPSLSASFLETLEEGGGGAGKGRRLEMGGQRAFAVVGCVELG